MQNVFFLYLSRKYICRGDRFRAKYVYLFLGLCLFSCYLLNILINNFTEICNFTCFLLTLNIKLFSEKDLKPIK